MDWDAEALGGEPSPWPAGGLLRLAGGALSHAGPLVDRLFPRPPTLVDQLRTAYLALQIRKLTGEAVVYREAGWGELLSSRRDVVVFGDRGSGKTALACFLCQLVSSNTGLPVVGIDFPPEAAAALGFDWVPSSDLHEVHDAVVLVDEAALTWGAKRAVPRLVDYLALARHRNVWSFVTTQSLAFLSRDVFRVDVLLAAKRVSSLAVRFEREEAVDLVTQAITIQHRHPELFALGNAAGESPIGTVVLDGSSACVAINGLPGGWDDSVSVARGRAKLAPAPIGRD